MCNGACAAEGVPTVSCTPKQQGEVGAEVYVCVRVYVCVAGEVEAMTGSARGYVLVPSRDHNTISDPSVQKDPHRSRMPSLSPSLTFTMLILRVSGAAAAWRGVACCMLHGVTACLAAAGRITAWLDGRTPGLIHQI